MKALLIVFIALGFASAGLSQNTNDYPKTVWANVGYASPDAALETWTWALSKGDKKVMLQSLTPEAQKEWHEELAGMTDEQIKAKSAKGAAKQSGYTIRQREVVSGEEVILH